MNRRGDRRPVPLRRLGTAGQVTARRGSLGWLVAGGGGAARFDEVRRVRQVRTEEPSPESAEPRSFARRPHGAQGLGKPKTVCGAAGARPRGEPLAQIPRDWQSVAAMQLGATFGGDRGPESGYALHSRRAAHRGRAMMAIAYRITTGVQGRFRAVGSRHDLHKSVGRSMRGCLSVTWSQEWTA
jgi:hypothetical protein